MVLIKTKYKNKQKHEAQTEPLSIIITPFTTIIIFIFVAVPQRRPKTKHSLQSRSLRLILFSKLHFPESAKQILHLPDTSGSCSLSLSQKRNLKKIKNKKNLIFKQAFGNLVLRNEHRRSSEHRASGAQVSL